MSESSDNMVLELLRAIRAEQADMSSKMGAMAQSMVSVRKDINRLDETTQGLRADVRMIAIAVDEHTQRLDKIEARLDTLCHMPPLN